MYCKTHDMDNCPWAHTPAEDARNSAYRAANTSAWQRALTLAQYSADAHWRHMDLSVAIAGGRMVVTGVARGWAPLSSMAEANVATATYDRRVSYQTWRDGR